MKKNTKTMTGGCLCGDVRYRAEGPLLFVAHCHCRVCQKASGSAFLTYVGLRTEDLRWINMPPTLYESSPGIKRGFCARCGSAMSFARPARGQISIFAGTLDQPDSIKPEYHMFTDQQFSWLHMADDIPRYGRFPPGAEQLDSGAVQD